MRALLHGPEIALRADEERAIRHDGRGAGARSRRDFGQRRRASPVTLAQPPWAKDSSDPSVLSLLIATHGTLTPKVTPDALGVSFCDASGATALNYAGLKVWDAGHKELTSRFESAGAGRVRLVVEESAARYPITIAPIAQQAYVKVWAMRALAV